MTDEKWLGVVEAVALVPGGCAHSIYRWCVRGISRNGGRVILRHIRVGKKFFTKATWIDEFIRQCTADETPATTRKRKLVGV